MEHRCKECDCRCDCPGELVNCIACSVCNVITRAADRAIEREYESYVAREYQKYVEAFNRNTAH